MKNKSIQFINTLIKYETTQGNDAIKKYTHGECSSLVYYLQQFNNGKGERIHIFYNEDEDNYNPTLHFVYKLNNKYYDINGGFVSLEKLIAKCPLFNKFEELEISVEYASLEDIDLEDDEKDFINIMEIINKTKPNPNVNSNKL